MLSKTPLTIVVFTDKQGKEKYTDILKRVIHSDLDKERYEIIFLGNSHRGFQHTVIYRKPLVRAFYDDTFNAAQKINGAIAEAHCPMILLWPGLSFQKAIFRPIPEDVVDPYYFLILWLRLHNSYEDWPLNFGKHPYRVNLKDTLRLLYKVGDCQWRIQLWYYGFLLKAVGLRLIGK